MRYLDSNLEYSEPQVGPKVHSIEYKVKYEYTDANQHLELSGPSSAVTGETVTYQVNLNSWSSSSDVAGWLPASQEFVKSSLNDSVSLYKYQNKLTFSFTMPDEDIVVWGYCNFHTVNHEPNHDVWMSAN